jgi:hypothetical protein
MLQSDMRDHVSNVVKEKVLFAREIREAILNLGKKLCIRTIKKNLKNFAQKPKDFGFPEKLTNDKRNPFMYPISKVWEYLLLLEKKGAINLRERGILSADDLFALNEFEAPEQILLESPVINSHPEDDSPTWHNIIKAFEQDND